MLLQNKNAIVYGAAGAIGRTVATAFAAEGATVFLTGRDAEALEKVAAEIHGAGGKAETAIVDALDEAAVVAHADEVAARAGSVDVSMNVITHGDVQGTPLIDMRVEDYVAPVSAAVRTTFITARAAARHMTRQGSGVILMFGGEGDPPRGGYLGGLQAAFHAMEAMRRQLATELGADGVRVVTLRTGGIPESLSPDLPYYEEVAEFTARAALTGRAATLEDVGNAAVFAASDRARSITATAINISAGAMYD
jgi:3-oxoacyl-[acyl-carrier protein] reductase